MTEPKNNPPRDARGRWPKNVSGNPSGRSKSFRRVRDAIASRLDEVLMSLFALIEKGDVAAIKLALERVSPALKPESDAQRIAGLEEAGTLGEKAQAVLREIAVGNIDAERGARVLAGIGSAAGLKDLEELKARLAALESRDLI